MKLNFIKFGLMLASFLCVSAISPISSQNKHQSLEVVEIDNEAFSKVKSQFETFKVEKRGKIATKINVSAPMKNFYSIEKMGLYNGQTLDGRTFNASIDSLDELGLMTIDLNVDNNISGENEIFERIYAYPTENDLGERDILFDIHGTKVLGSDVLRETLEPEFRINDDRLIINRPIIDIGFDTNVLYPIVNVSFSLANLSSVQTLASSVMAIPALSLTNPLPYFLYTAKVELAKQHYEHNVAQTNQPGSVITDQNNYSNFKYGISDQPLGKVPGCNVGTKGCGMVAAYNMLKESGANITFPSLIALYELCGADLLFGYFGVNPVPDYLDTVIIPAASAALLAVYSLVLQPILNLALTIVEPMLFALCVWTPLDLLIPGISLTAAVTAAATLRVIINDAGRVVNEFLNWYSTYSKSESEMLSMFFGNHIEEFSILEFSGFKTKLANRRQAIICFWNGVYPDGSVNIGDGAHYIYIHGTSIDSYGTVSFKAINNTHEGPYTAANVKNFFSSSKQANQFIWGYILN